MSLVAPSSGLGHQCALSELASFPCLDARVTSHCRRRFAENQLSDFACRADRHRPPFPLLPCPTPFAAALAVSLIRVNKARKTVNGKGKTKSAGHKKRCDTCRCQSSSRCCLHCCCCGCRSVCPSTWVNRQGTQHVRPAQVFALFATAGGNIGSSTRSRHGRIICALYCLINVLTICANNCGNNNKRQAKQATSAATSNAPKCAQGFRLVAYEQSGAANRQSEIEGASERASETAAR